MSSESQPLRTIDLTDEGYYGTVEGKVFVHKGELVYLTREGGTWRLVKAYLNGHCYNQITFIDCIPFKLLGIRGDDLYTSYGSNRIIDLDRCVTTERSLQNVNPLFKIVQCDTKILAVDKLGRMTVYDTLSDRSLEWDGQYSAVTGGDTLVNFQIMWVNGLVYIPSLFSLIYAIRIREDLTPVRSEIIKLDYFVDSWTQDEDYIYMIGRDYIQNKSVVKYTKSGPNGMKLVACTQSTILGATDIIVCNHLLVVYGNKGLCTMYKHDLGRAPIFLDTESINQAFVWYGYLMTMADKHTVAQWTEPFDWSIETHHVFGNETRLQIKMLWLLNRTRNNSQVTKLPLDIMRIICWLIPLDPVRYIHFID